jgi:hypothetical protein
MIPRRCNAARPYYNKVKVIYAQSSLSLPKCKILSFPIPLFISQIQSSLSKRGETELRPRSIEDTIVGVQEDIAVDSLGSAAN